MKIFLFIIIGISGGILGGMGMGGGTLLIPFLTIFAKVGQHIAQTINLVAFIPMSLVTLIIHTKNKMVKYKYLLTLSLPAVGAGVFSAWLAKKIQAVSLSKYFGIFLLLLGIYQLVCLVLQIRKEKKEKGKTEISGTMNNEEKSD